MKYEIDHRKTTDLLALLVFGVFALCVAAVLLTGAGTYQKLTERDSRTFDHRTAARYLTTRYHQAAAVEIGDFCGIEAMIIREEFGGRAYLTRVYCYDGSIRELLAAETAQVSPEDGELVMEAECLDFAQETGLLAVQITHPDGEIQRLLLNLPQWKEAAS